MKLLKVCLFGLMFVGLGLVSCSSEEDAGENENASEKEGKKSQEQEPESKVCTYEYIDDMSISWTAYKHTAKNPVNGAFADFVIEGAESANNLKDAIKSMKVKAKTNSVVTQDTTRDRKIKQYFFNMMEMPEYLVGQVTELNGDDSEGTGTMELVMNNMTNTVPIKYTRNAKGILTITGKVDVLNWNGDEALASISDACSDKHTGEDGVRKTWNTMNFNISGMVDKFCE